MLYQSNSNFAFLFQRVASYVQILKIASDHTVIIIFNLICFLFKAYFPHLENISFQFTLLKILWEINLPSSIVHDLISLLAFSDSISSTLIHVYMFLCLMKFKEEFQSSKLLVTYEEYLLLLPSSCIKCRRQS